MFSGIVEETGKVIALDTDRDNLHLTIECSFVNEIKIDQSISHNGVCLTVVRIFDTSYTVTAIKETLLRSNLGLLQIGDEVNLERSMRLNDRLDGHIVQGHVDQTATCTKVSEVEGSWYYWFEFPATTDDGCLTVEKGSIAVNGVSLTVVESTMRGFSVAIIPYTYQITNFHTFKPGTVVNIEFDVIGKYVVKILKQMGKA